MKKVSEAVDSYMLALDPMRGLRAFGDDLGRYAALDPRIQEAMSLVNDRLNGLSEAERSALAPIVWTSARSALTNPHTLGRLRRFGVDGGTILPAVERALDEELTIEVLQRVVQEADVLAKADGSKSLLIQQAAAELNSPGGQDVLLEAAVVVAIIVIIALPVVIVASAIDW